ncbi:MAG: GreA/GreB family elongation factor [Bacteroidales bacterium]|nr:GreA/GreB family elongation factor [Bacteroidales bacterium]
MSRGFIKEGDQEEIPMVPPRAYLPPGVPNYVTKEGLAALNEELKNLQAERAKAGDNYIMGNFIDAKMKLLVSRINSALEVDLAKANKDTVSFGAWVRYNGRVVRIVGVDEADVDQGLLSFTSPIAKSLTGKKAGDVIELKGPKGSERITVEAVSFEPMELTKIVHEKHAETPATTDKRNQRTVIEQLEQTQQEVQADADDLSDKVDEPAGFGPEVDPMEFLPIVNERGNIVGRALHLELHQGNKMLHPAVHLHVMNGKGELAGLYWWHVAFGDTPEKTLKRKMAETLGLQKAKPVLKRQYVREAKTEKELVYVYTVVSDEKMPQSPEATAYLELFAKDQL